MEQSFLERHPRLKDIVSFVTFILLVGVGTLLINNFVFRSFNVEGPSMEKTFYTGDRLIVNRLPVTVAQAQNKPYVPERGQIIVFQNPRFIDGQRDAYLVKRVIALPGERVVVKDGTLTVYNIDHPAGFQPDDYLDGPGSPSSGDSDMTVPEQTLYVAGDHREGNFSYDSRSGLGTVPFYDVIGPVSLRIFPFNKIATY